MSCEVCRENQFKYKCPGCTKKTCSVACVSLHKQETGCSGKRDKTKFVAVKDFSDSNLLSDYRLLEETYRKVDASSRDAFQNKSYNNRTTKELLRAAKRQGVQLKCLPYPMTKRRRNKSAFMYGSDSASRRIMWFIDWIFEEADATYSRRCDELRTLNALLLEFLHPTKSDPVIRHKLQQYVAVLKPITPSVANEEKADLSDNSKDLCFEERESEEGQNELTVTEPSVSTKQSEESKKEGELSKSDQSTPDDVPITSCEHDNVTTDSLQENTLADTEATNKNNQTHSCTQEELTTKPKGEAEHKNSDESTSTNDEGNAVDYTCDKIGLFMKLDDLPANVTKYKRLDLSKSLAENLKGQIIIEFPTIHVALERNWSKYELKD